MNTGEYWEGEFGDEYTKRNRVDWQRRIPFWKKLLLTIGARSILEYGCGSGWNLSAIKRSFSDIALAGVEINKSATYETTQCGFAVYDNIGRAYKYDLVFTAGVLIHTAPEDLGDVMLKIIEHSREYVLAIEYFAEKETPIEYWGSMDKLWKRNYGQLYEDLGLTQIEDGFLDRPAGFDNCHWGLFKK